MYSKYTDFSVPGGNHAPPWDTIRKMTMKKEKRKKDSVGHGNKHPNKEK